MDFPKSLSVEACEKFLNDLEAAKSDVSLQFPVGTKGYAFGGLASAIQAVNTWVRSSETRRIELRKSDASDVVDDLIARPHKFVAAMSSRSIVMNDSQDSDLRPLVNSKARQAIHAQSQHQYGQQRGGLCWFGFVDHSSKGFDQNFYIKKTDKNPEPRQPEQFKTIIKSMTEKAISVPGGAKAPEHEALDHLGRIFYELFLNTHEHGTKGKLRHEWLKPGVRIIYAQGINLSEAGTKGIISQQPVLSDYVQSIESKLNVQGSRRFLELGIIDSGLGYCGRWQADHPLDNFSDGPSLDAEYETFKKCFKFRQTSTSEDNKGNGLPVVMDRLTRLNGLMRIRSGRLSVYRDFVTSPYSDQDSCVFFDWLKRTSAEQDLSRMTHVAGVAISLLIPLEAKS
ncbi:hypothetical protein S7S_13240 [Isoalcanivorax pacificus W11-5]|uniref:Uncharacterized protein n=1 Tax=Isoalcanivorax pacificus W11-5 TaxID=391936 RepID=A0A0B4XQJ4_9GAMM|nr:hypothetical protein [Isoalcanivorax pacificus]AJD49060.1 hypothetical protein S7S_13240 [Isoalcanivorax pacificus W11-5]